MPNLTKDIIITEEIQKLCFSSKTRWLLYLPFDNIKWPKDYEKISALSLNLKDFQIPEMSLNYAPAHYQGEFINLPSNVKSYEKTFNVNYIMSEDWSQFNILSDYFDMLSGLETSAANYEKLEDILITPELFVLSAFKNPIFSLKFHIAWLYKMGELTFSYDDVNDEVVTQNIGFTYTYWTKSRFINGKMSNG